MKGLKDWVEIFKGGKQIDGAGKEHDGDALIDKAINTFNTAKHEPPVVIGHPASDAPAFGWVEGLKSEARNGAKVLMAKFKQVVPEFEELVEQGLYKKRSAAFYADGSLRHVGFLGAMPPAVKGLADIKFSDEARLSFEFYDPGKGIIAGILRNLRDYFIEKEGKEKADAVIPDWDIEYLKEEANKQIIDTKENVMANGFKEKVKGILSLMGVDMSKVPDNALPDALPASVQGAFSEADIEAAKAEALKQGETKARAEFAEQARKNAKKATIKALIDVGITEGKILPAWKDKGMATFMEALPDGELQFSDTVKQSPYAWFEEFLKDLGANPLFQEIASKQRTGTAASEATRDAELGKSIAKRAR